MHASFKEIPSQLLECLLQSKHLVVVLGMINGHCHIMVPLTPPKGAGVSQAAGIQPFRGSGGLLNASSHSGNVLDLFDKDTFQVRSRLVPVSSF
jgi:hypothetical protein